MSRIFYENFDLTFSRLGDKKFRVRLSGASSGEASTEISLEDAPEEVVNVLTRNFSLDGLAAGNPHATLAGGRPEVGSYLYRTLFQDSKMFGVWNVALDRAKNRGAYLRLRLNLTDTAELVGLPWEMLTSESNILAFAVKTSVVRYQDVFLPKEFAEIQEKPLRMLVVISNPAVPGMPPLKVEEERQRINRALQPLVEQRLIELEILPRATLTQLDNRLLDDSKPVIHIFHYIGHGRFNQTSGVGELLFEADFDDVIAPDEAAAVFEWVDGKRLGHSLHNHGPLRMASLNACEGAMVSDADSYAGVAQHLLRTGDVPVVIAMRRAISDDLAIVFAQTFYQWLLVNNVPVDIAMTRARLRMRDAEQKRDLARTPTEWGTPIILMRNHDGYLVNFQNNQQPLVPATLPADIDPPLVKHYQTVMNVLTQGKLVPFLGLDVNLFGRAPVNNWQPDNHMPTLPSYHELVHYLATVSHHPVPFIPALADVSQYTLLHYIKDEDKGEGTFYSDLMKIFARADQPTALHQFWARIAAHNEKLTGGVEKLANDVTRRFLILSNTYDNLLERAFKQTLDRFHVVSYVAHGDNMGKFRHTVYAKTEAGGTEPMPQAPVIVESATTYGGLYDQAAVILKIPGTVGDAAGLRFAITEDQYLDFFARRELASILPSQVLTKLRNSNHLFLGYNVREWSLRALLYRIWDDHKPPLASWSIQEQPTQVEKNYWEACKVRIIERNLTKYLHGLRLSCQTLLPGVDL